MADVLVKGMYMPKYLIEFDEEIKSCDGCPFCKTNDDLDAEDYRYMYCGYPQMGEFVGDYIACRHPDCPLVELPPCSCIIKADDVPVYSKLDGDYIFKKDLDEHTIYKNYEE